MAEKFDRDRALGMLLGHHAGDALGATLEGKASRTPGDFHMEITGGGTLKWGAGEATDDTDLQILVLQMLAEHGTLDERDLCTRLIHWLDGKPKDVGATTLSAISAMRTASDPTKCGRSGLWDQGNGSLMRCAPLALLGLDGERLRHVAHAQTVLTHAHAACADTDYLYLTALRAALAGQDKEAIYDAVRAEAIRLGGMLAEWIPKVRETKWDQLPADKKNGWCIITLFYALWGMLHAQTFEDALILVVNRGDDADSTGAVTGALCGAYYGLPTIPSRWVLKLKRRQEIERLYDKISRRG